MYNKIINMPGIQDIQFFKKNNNRHAEFFLVNKEIESHIFLI